jgi:hypothetical protein
MKPIELRDWAIDAAAGGVVVYHVGTYAQGDTCREAMALSEGGLVALVRKRRQGSHVFEYMAQRTKTKMAVKA